MKRLLTLIFIICLSFIAFHETPNASAWIGTGTSGGGGSGGGSGSCGGEIDKYGISCAGVSWAFYKAQGQTDSWTEFPYINSGLRVPGASIPPECSKSGGGFWHFGINSFGAYLVDGEIWTTTASWAREYGSPWWGHWLTMNPGNNATSWAPYKTSGLGNRQWVGVYQMDYYGSWDAALKAYQEAYLYEHPGADKPTYIPGDVWGFCWGPYMQEVTLTVKSIDTNGNSLSHLMADKTDKKAPGERHSVTIGNIDGYSKMYWGTSTDRSTWTSNTDLTYSENITTNKTIYAIYEYNEYQGASQVAEVNADWNSIPASQKKSTGWTKSNKQVIHFINNCSPTNGCTAKFWHNLRRISGLGSTTFNITRTSNYYTIDSGTVVSSRSETFSSASEINERTFTYINQLYPGQIVCETLTFNANTSSSNIKTTACASALGNAQPSDSTLLDIKVKNESTTNNFQTEVYAKPGDKVTFQTTYNPILQYAYRLLPQKLQINSGSIYPSGSTINSAYTLQQLFNNRYSGKDWNNAFSVQQSKNNFKSSTLISNNKFSVGNTTKRTIPNTYRNNITLKNEIGTEDVGLSIDQKASTNLNSTTQTTPSQINFNQNNNTYNVANVSTTNKNSTAHARVPYNYVNTTNVASNESTTTFYAGESATINFNINTLTKYNVLTRGTYATIVDSAKWKLIFCVGQTECSNGNYNYETTPGSKDQPIPTTGKLNASRKTAGDSTNKPITINIPDVPAGTLICVRSAVYPATSGNDSNWQDKEGDRQWAYSKEPACFTVAKRPSLQIWGGNSYINGKASTAIATKGHLAGYTNYNVETKYQKPYIFGSWTELGLIASGTITNFTSGASLGYTANNNGTLIANPGGNTTNSKFTLSPLTFANQPLIGNLGNTTAKNSIENDKSAILSKFEYGGATNTDTTVNLDGPTPENIKGDNIYYYSGDKDLSIPTSVITANTTQIVHSTKNITITGNLTYPGNYTNFHQLPKLVIYADNIIINCDVTRVDALLIANQRVVTCNNFDSDFANFESNIKKHLNDPANSNQLTINGAIIAGGLTPNRTYGAATGANSIVPAEIINYDPSLYLWGSTQAKTTDTSFNLDTTYQTELAPRR